MGAQRVRRDWRWHIARNQARGRDQADAGGRNRLRNGCGIRIGRWFLHMHHQEKRQELVVLGRQYRGTLEHGRHRQPRGSHDFRGRGPLASCGYGRGARLWCKNQWFRLVLGKRSARSIGDHASDHGDLSGHRPDVRAYAASSGRSVERSQVGFGQRSWRMRAAFER